MSNENETMLRTLYDYLSRKDTEENDFNNSLERNIHKIKDGFENSILGIGNDDHLANFDNYVFENNTLNWYLWLALYNESWVFRRTIDKPSQDMIRPSISILGSADYSKVYQQLDTFKPNLIDAVKWSKLFGGSVMVLLFQNISFTEMEKPLDYEKIKGCKVIRSYVTDRWFGCNPSYNDIVSNLANIDFGKPKYYTIQFSNGESHKIHHSWVLRFENRGAPNLIKTGQLQGWGYAEGAHILRELQRDEKLKNSIQSLVDKSLIEVIKMSGMRGVFMGADKGNEQQLRKRLEMVNWGRNFNSLTFLDKDDDYQQHNFGGLSGLSDLLDLNMRQIASACEMPNVLYGDLSNGFTSDDSALERYDEKILGDCDTYLKTPFTKLLRILFNVYDVRDDEGKIPQPVFTFNSIITDKKNDKKITEFTNFYSLCKDLVSDNLMTIEDEKRVLQEYLNTGSINFHLNENIKVEKTEPFNSDENDEGSMDIGSNLERVERNIKRPKETKETKEKEPLPTDEPIEKEEPKEE